MLVYYSKFIWKGGIDKMERSEKKIREFSQKWLEGEIGEINQILKEESMPQITFPQIDKEKENLSDEVNRSLERVERRMRARREKFYLLKTAIRMLMKNVVPPPILGEEEEERADVLYKKIIPGDVLPQYGRLIEAGLKRLKEDLDENARLKVATHLRQLFIHEKKILEKCRDYLWMMREEKSELYQEIKKLIGNLDRLIKNAFVEVKKSQNSRE